jgi:hypothetical protein
MKDHLVLLATAVVFFTWGACFCSNGGGGGQDYAINTPASKSAAAALISFRNSPLQEKMHAQEEIFQKLSTALSCSSSLSASFSSSSSKKRILRYYPTSKQQQQQESFLPQQLHELARVLLVAMATERTLQVGCSFLRDGDYASTALCKQLEHLISSNHKHCLIEASLPEKKPQSSPTNQNPARYGILPDITTSQDYYFNPLLYSENIEAVDMPEWPYPKKGMITVLPHYERMWGRFFVKSQVLEFIWQQLVLPTMLQKNKTTSTRTPPIILPVPPDNHPYLAISLDTSNDTFLLAEQFGRNATQTQAEKRLLALATRIQTAHNSQQGRRLEWVVLDLPTGEIGNHHHHDHLVQLFQNQGGWINIQVLSSPLENQFQVDRLEILRQAEYLVGSFSSRKFRVATELNAANHLKEGLSTSGGLVAMKRRYGLDVEWYDEDPGDSF